MKSKKLDACESTIVLDSWPSGEQLSRHVTTVTRGSTLSSRVVHFCHNVCRARKIQQLPIVISITTIELRSIMHDSNGGVTSRGPTT